MITHISPGKGGVGHFLAKTRVNPYHITSYIDAVIPNYNGKEDYIGTAIFCGGQAYIVDMTIEEVDKMMDSIDRSLSFDDNE